MKLSLRTLPHLVSFLFIGFLLGGLAWELLERLLSLADFNLDLHMGPLLADGGFFRLELWFSPGSVLGTAGGVSLFMAVK